MMKKDICTDVIGAVLVFLKVNHKKGISAMWRLGKYLSSCIMPELEELKNKCNFTDDENIVFEMLSKNKSIAEIGIETKMSETTISRRISDIKRKVEKVNGKNYT